MQLQLRTFDTIVSSAAAAVQAAATTVLDLTVGSVLRAVLEANAGLGLWLQWLILQVLQTTRAATSTAGDLDTWMADFGLTRLAAVPASGIVTFSRFSPSTTALVPVGTLVRTADGSQSFAVVVDTTNPAWSATQNGFSLPAGTASVTVAVRAAAAGSAGNVQTGAVSLIAAALPGVDTVSNAAPTIGGLDAEADAGLRARFAAYLPADLSDPLVKMGLVLAPQNFTLTAPGTAGTTMAYLVQAATSESDQFPVVLPYYNAANPAMPYLGPGNSGAAQMTVRQQRVSVQVKAGTPVSSGPPPVPATDPGWFALAAVQVSAGATQVNQSSIFTAQVTRFTPWKLPDLTPGFAFSQAISTSGTFFVPNAVTRLRVTVIGAGGAGGSCVGSASVGGGGGGAGGLGKAWLTAMTPGAAIAVTVGAVGVAASGSTGGPGGTSSFGTYCSATGGAGGTAGTGSSSGIGGAGGTASGASIVYPGSTGTDAVPGIARGGDGGGPGGGKGSSSGATGANAASWGGGGGGASAAGFNGGSGGGGLVIVEW